jgi:hypothetical protein
MKKPRYQGFLNDLATGLKYGVFVDDTGSPGLESAPPNLHPERKSWVGVVVPPNQMPEVIEQLPRAIEELRCFTGAEEFHFADIYAAKGRFRGINLQVRLALFKFMAKIFSIYKFPIFVQTFDPTSLDDIRKRAPFPNRVGPFNLTKPNDTALFFLLIRIKQYIEKNRSGSETARVFVDEGYKRNGTAIYIPSWKSVFADGLICFARSSSIHPIQLADFAAFALNRTQLLIGKKKLNSLDKQLLEILSPMAWNYQNIEKRVIRFEEI